MNNFSTILSKLGLTGRFIAWFAGISLIILAVLGAVGLGSAQKYFMGLITMDMNSFVLSREGEMRLLEDMRLSQLSVLAMNQGLQELYDEFSRPGLTFEERSALKAEMMVFAKEELVEFDKATGDHSRFVMVLADGTVIYDTIESNIGRPFEDMGELREVVQTGQKTSHHYEGDGQGINELTVPVYSHNGTSPAPIGILRAFADFSDLNKLLLINDDNGLGKTVESYLISEHGYMMTESRFVPDAPFNQKALTVPYQVCFEGRTINADEKHMIWKNYLGEDVVGAFSCSEHMVLVVEMHESEAVGPIIALRNEAATTAMILLFGVMGVSIFASRSLSEFVRRPIRAAVEQMNAASQQLSSSTQQSAAASQQNSSIAQQVASGATEQSEKAEEISKAVSEMASAIQQMASSSMEASAAATQTSQIAQTTSDKGNESRRSLDDIKMMVQGTAEMIRGMSDKSKSIGDIVETITTIAEQTNLLALNAAIEAARAGDAGRGFAVVADEVRKLAEGSGKAAEEIKGRIKDMLDQINDSVATVEMGVKRADESSEVINETLSNLQSMAASIQQVTAKIQEVTAGVNQQSTAVQQVAKTMDSIAAISEQNASGAQQLSASAQQQSSANQQVAAAAQQLQALAEDLAALAGGMQMHTNALREAKEPVMLAKGQVEHMKKVVTKTTKEPSSTTSKQKPTADDEEANSSAHKVT